jgi:hypothetical protein
MFSGIRLVIVCALLVVACGCGMSADEKKIIGDWKGEFRKNNQKPIAGANITFDSEHRWRELYHNLEVKGSWSLEGKTLTLKPDTIGGTSVEEAQKRVLVKGKSDKAALAMAAGMDKPIPLKVSDDFRTLTTEYDNNLGGFATYTKQ